MNHCCSQSGPSHQAPKKLACPVNHKDYIRVPLKTILHHLKQSWNYTLIEQAYYYCDDPDCEVVYFSEDNSVIKKSELRTPIAAKEKYQDAFICHCFGVSLEDVTLNPDIKEFVIQQTKQGNCSCETSNPSGRCCLKDFPKI